ncbi:MAG: methyltransferase domain-containing protein, partial [Thermicanus sp.]|nr:methyltransferase domain-containing protein [Thermicanus sp.]
MEIHPGERLDLISKSGLKIIQSKEVFSFSLDAVLLADFANVPKKGRIIDLCTGTGVIPLLISQKTEGEIYGVEIQERLWDMAERSRKINQLEKRVCFILGDIKDMPARFGDGRFDY